MKRFRLLAFAVVFAGAAASAHAALVADALTSNALTSNSLAIGAVSGNARATAVELPAGSN